MAVRDVHAHRFQVLSMLVAAAASTSLVPMPGCGGETDASTATSRASNDGGPDASRGYVPESPGMATSQETIDESHCELQRSSTSYSTPSMSVCAWEGTLPCTPALTPISDAGSVAGEEGDGGSDVGLYPTDADVSGANQQRCEVLCNSIKPPATSSGFRPWCRVYRHDASLVVSCGGCGVGRPPRGFVAEKVHAPSVAATWLAEVSQLEAASVDAFLALHDDLARLGAPSSLLHAIRIAADDEVRHAELTRREAERLGAEVPIIASRAAAPRTAEQMALENAEDGCVKETFGAVLARIQAARATDRSIRALMGQLAADELGHAALSWRVAAWLDAQLDEASRARVASARQRALVELDAELARGGRGIPELGIPDGAHLRAALAHVQATLADGRLAA